MNKFVRTIALMSIISTFGYSVHSEDLNENTVITLEMREVFIASWNANLVTILNTGDAFTFESLELNRRWDKRCMIVFGPMDAGGEHTYADLDQLAANTSAVTYDNVEPVTLQSGDILRFRLPRFCGSSLIFLEFQRDERSVEVKFDSLH